MKKSMLLGIVLLMLTMFGGTAQPASAWWHNGQHYRHRTWHHNWVWRYHHRVDRGWWVYW